MRGDDGDYALSRGTPNDNNQQLKKTFTMFLAPFWFILLDDPNILDQYRSQTQWIWGSPASIIHLNK